MQSAPLHVCCLLREEHYCYPVGAALGGLAGFGNEYLREQEEGIPP